LLPTILCGMQTSGLQEQDSRVTERRSAVRRWVQLARVLLFMVACALIVAIVAPIAKRFSGVQPEVLIGTLTSIATLGVTLLFLRWDGVQAREVGIAPRKGSIPRFVGGFVLGLVLVLAWAGLFAIVAPVRWTRSPHVGLAACTGHLAGYLALSLREELAFHAYPLRRLERGFGLWGAQLIVATGFALEHRLGGWSWMQAVLGAGVGSLLFGMAALATRGLAVPLGLHAAWNLGHWSLGAKGEPGLWKMNVPEDSNANLQAMACYWAVFGLATMGLWWRYRNAAATRTCPVA